MLDTSIDHGNAATMSLAIAAGARIKSVLGCSKARDQVISPVALSTRVAVTRIVDVLAETAPARLSPSESIKGCRAAMTVRSVVLVISCCNSLIRPCDKASACSPVAMPNGKTAILRTSTGAEYASLVSIPVAS